VSFVYLHLRGVFVGGIGDGHLGFRVGDGREKTPCINICMRVGVISVLESCM
jgi:hypothetical protein